MPSENQDHEVKQPTQPLLSRFVSALWWRNVWLTLSGFLPRCITAAVLWTLAGVIVLLGSWQGSQAFAAGATVTIESLLKSMGIMLIASLAGIGLLIWSLVLWLVNVTAYTRSFMTLRVGGQLLEKSAIATSQKEAMAHVAARKAFLAKFWLLTSVCLTAPMIVLMILMSVKLAATPQLTGTPMLTLSPLANAAIITTLLLIVVAGTAVSLVAVIVAATTDLAPGQATKQVFSISCRHWLPLLLLTSAVIIIDSVVGSPQSLLSSLTDPDSMFTVSHNVKELVIDKLWQGATSVVLWTFTMVPICELLRKE